MPLYPFGFAFEYWFALGLFAHLLYRQASLVWSPCCKSSEEHQLLKRLPQTNAGLGRRSEGAGHSTYSSIRCDPRTKTCSGFVLPATKEIWQRVIEGDNEYVELEELTGWSWEGREDLSP